MKLEMVDLRNQYKKVKTEIDQAILSVIENANFINGEQVSIFSNNLSTYLDNSNVIPCANGTDALQIAMMALNLNPGDEVIVPAFTYVATAEVLGLLQLRPVLVDVDPKTFNISTDSIKQALSSKTKAIVPVHLFGQCADMEEILNFAKENHLYVIEDTAQAIGAIYKFQDGRTRKAGTLGDIGCTSFFPSKNLGCYGDGGSLYTHNSQLATIIRMICNHGQVKKYVHKYIGVNSRLDTIQAAILNIKLKYLDEYNNARLLAADEYDKLLSGVHGIEIPFRSINTTHVFHQYTIKVKNNKRDNLKSFLEKQGVPAMIYYPIPLNKQEAYNNICRIPSNLSITEELCNEVLSLPMHSELTQDQIEFITNQIKSFFN